MKKKPLILVGAGGHAKACIDVIENNGEFYIYGIIDNSKINRILGYPILGKDKDLKKYVKKVKYLLITVGQIRNNQIRPKLYNLGKKLGYKFPKIFSKRSYISKHSKIQEGTIVFHDVIINSGAKIGKNCIINNKCLIEHDVSIGDHCHVSTKATINGSAKIGNKSFIGSGSLISNSILLPKNSFVKIGSIIT